jgi:hypothetical protein
VIEEHKIERALAVGLNKIQPSSDLLDRINREADQLAQGGTRSRQSLWSRLRLGPKLELVAACILLVGLVGIAAFRNLNPSHAPAGGDKGSGTQGTASETLNPRIYSGDASDGMVRVDVVLDHQGNGDWHVISTIQNVFTGTVEVLHQCDNLVGFDQSLIKRDCIPSPTVVLEPGQTKREELTLPGRYQGTPTRGWLAYSIRSEGKQDPVRTLTVSIQEGVRQCCPEPGASSLQPTTGIDDIANTGIQVTFAEPTSPAKLTEDDAKAIAVQRFGAPPAGSPVTVEYKLMTDETNKSRPVYLVTYHNLPPTPSTGPLPPTKASQSLQRRLTVFIDANSGEYLNALSR